MDRALEVDIMKKIPTIFRKCTVLALTACMVQIAHRLLGKNGGGGATVPFLDYLTCRSGCFGITGTEGKLLFVWGNGTKPLYPNRLLDID